MYRRIQVRFQAQLSNDQNKEEKITPTETEVAPTLAHVAAEFTHLLMKGVDVIEMNASQ